MIDRHIVYYLGSKIVSAAINLLTLALFVRLGGAETYGGYLVALAWATILYGVTMQWLRFSFFACFREARGADFIATYLRAMAIGFAVIGAAVLIGNLLGYLTPDFASALLVLTLGLAGYDALHEIARTQLRAGYVSLGILARAILMLGFGIVALGTSASWWSLAIAVGFAHLGAALLLLYGSRDRLGGDWSKTALKSLWGYGAPLIPAFGFDAMGLQLDRLLLAHFASLQQVGAYGTATDFIRQLMIVFSEAVANAYLPLARADAVEGRYDAASLVLREAFLAYTALTAFAAVVILRFDRLIFDTAFGTSIGEAVEPIIPIIMASNAAGIFRAYYFQQASYLTDKPNILLLSNATHLASVAIAGLLLVPRYGMAGAAYAMLLAHLLGCLVYIVAWRGRFVMRLPLFRAGIIVAIAALTYLVGAMIEANWGPSPEATIAECAVIGGAILFVARSFNILSFNDLSAKAWFWLRRPRQA